MHVQYYEYSIQLAYSNALMTMYCTVVVIVHLDCGRTKADGRFGMLGSAWTSRSVRSIRDASGATSKDGRCRSIQGKPADRLFFCPRYLCTLAVQTFPSLTGLKLDRFHHATKTDFQTTPKRLANPV